jgi:NADH dehydrogenase
LLYQVATGALSPANIAASARRSQKTEEYPCAAWRSDRFRYSQPQGNLSDGELDYDTLIVAVGVRHHYFGNEHWEACARTQDN